MLNRNHKYINFILDKLKTSLYSSGFDISGSDANKALNFLANSDDVLRDIFVLSRYKQCGSLCSYLLFIYKKLDENSLKYENLPVNIEYDVEYLKRILIGNFKLNKSEDESASILEAEEKIFQDNQNQWEVSDEISESKFKVGEIERDIVTEEFSEDEIDVNRLKDLNPEDEENIEEIISVSLEEVKESFADSNDEEIEEHEQENINPQQAGDTEIIESIDSIEEPETSKDEAFDLSDLIESKQPEEKHVQNELFDYDEKEKTYTEPEQLTEEKILFEETTERDLQSDAPEPDEDADDGSILEISTEHLDIQEEKPEEKIDNIDAKEDESNYIIEQNEVPVSETEDEQESQLTAADGKSKKFIEFENNLIFVNKEMNVYFDEITALSKNYDENNSIIKDQSETVSQNAFVLSKATSEMTFEVISNIYNFIGDYFEKANKTPFEIRQGDLRIFSHSLHVIEKFILEEDFSGIEKTLGDYYHIESYVAEMELQKKSLEETETVPESIDTTSAETVIESFEAIESIEKITEEERNVKEEQTQETGKVIYEKKEETDNAVVDNSRKKLMMILKAEIMELEIIFKSIDEIEGNYKIYEGLRKLSKTYNVLKKTVALSKRLDMNKLARLSEACYIFIKFIQNYRLSPFDDDIKQIFNYIIYNYKLIALDKPTKDFEEFIFYLNDPVKIFTQKKKNQ